MALDFKNIIVKNFSFLENKKLFIAVSGGLDSMVLLHLTQKISSKITILHCNFQLRNAESDEDADFVADYAKSKNITMITKKFDTEFFAQQNKLSIQVAARELRYRWFNGLLLSENYDYLLTAHHADDNLETFLINLSRGTGLEGLTGIPVQNNKIIRPLLSFSREEIVLYAQEKEISWREDSSNASDKYLRNRIRHHLAPILKEMNPNFIHSFQNTQLHLQASQRIIKTACDDLFAKIATITENAIYFNLTQILSLPNYKDYLYQWLKKYGFTAWNDIYDLVLSQSGKQVFSPQYRLLKNRNDLILSKLERKEIDSFFIEENQTEIKTPLRILFSEVSEIKNQNEKCVFIDKKLLKYPLEIRKWRKGDYFEPSGMNGKSQKVSKFFKDKKLSLLDKEQKWLLCSDNKIVWIIGLRQDYRFKASSKTEQILKIELKIEQ